MPASRLFAGWCAKASLAFAGRVGRRMRSLLLTGSVARDEATILVHPGGWRLLGDADFIVVFEPHAPLPPAGALAGLTAKCESDLRAAGVVAHIGIAAVHDDYFPRLPAHIYTYELRRCGRVVCGDDNPLELIPRFTASAIDKEDAWRLLANRYIECLELSENLCSAAAAGVNPGGGRAALSRGEAVSGHGDFASWYFWTPMSPHTRSGRGGCKS